MIVIDPLRIGTFRGKHIKTAHMLSTLHGEDGTAELIAFAKRIGMRALWIQHKGEPKEHFDLMGTRCQSAIDAGATVDRNLLVRAIGEKRAGSSTRVP